MATNKCPLEHVEQTLYFEWLADEMPFIDEHTFAVPNGSYKSAAAAAKFKREGLKPGVLDVWMIIPTANYNLLVIEFKRQKGGSTSPEQKKWIHRLKLVRCRVEVCRGFEAAKVVTLDYLKEFLKR